MDNNLNKILKEQNQKLEHQSKQIEKLTLLVESLLKEIKVQPKQISLATLCHDTGIKRQTLYAHILNNYEPGVDFDKVNNSIMIRNHIVPLIKKYYERKKKISRK